MDVKGNAMYTSLSIPVRYEDERHHLTLCRADEQRNRYSGETDVPGLTLNNSLTKQRELTTQFKQTRTFTTGFSTQFRFLLSPMPQPAC